MDADFKETINSQTDSQSWIEQAREEFANAAVNAELENYKSKYLGKSGLLSKAFATLSRASSEDKKKLGKQINYAKNEIEELLNLNRKRLATQAISKKLKEESIDVTLPGRQNHSGSLHPLTITRRKIETIFRYMGYDVADGPEIELDEFNFTALNFPEDHPARSMHDTFFIKNEKTVLLRTHTSPVQIRHMQQQKPPIKVIAAGRVYRVDSDATHSPMFQQVEGLCIDEGINFSHLKGTFATFLREFFNAPQIKLRCRPSYFPFTEPSAEFDMSCVFCKDGSGCKVCSKTGWIEIAGCGMVHPNVLKAGNVDTQKYQGWAFGVGVDRLAMIMYGINDLRLFYENDQRFLKQF